jgi:alpha-1,3-rhamnosyl/mannosyltransferase
VGTLEPRKNVARLLEAYKQLDPALQAAWPLLLVGDKGWLTETLAASLEQQSQVRWLGYVPDEDMPGLYQAAGVFVYVSLFEGFGMPVLEAMVNGVPVLTSNVSSMPEVAGDAALLVNPLSIDDIADSLRTLLQDESLRQALAVAGQERAQRFNWKESARRLVDIGETLVSGDNV